MSAALPLALMILVALVVALLGVSYLVSLLYARFESLERPSKPHQEPEPLIDVLAPQVPIVRECICGVCFVAHPASVETQCDACVARRFEAAEEADRATWERDGWERRD